MSEYKGIAKISKVGTGFKLWRTMVKGHLGTIGTGSLLASVESEGYHADDFLAAAEILNF